MLHHREVVFKDKRTGERKFGLIWQLNGSKGQRSEAKGFSKGPMCGPVEISIGCR